MGPSVLFAEENWWGDSTGPYHATQNPLGRRDTVVGKLAFDPWMTDTLNLNAGQAKAGAPESCILEAYPNPFNSDLRIRVAGFEGKEFRLTLHNLLGQEVAMLQRGPLVDREVNYHAPQSQASGVYFLKVSDRKATVARKVVFLK